MAEPLTTDPAAVRDAVRDHYAAAARQVSDAGAGACCGAQAAGFSCCGTSETCGKAYGLDMIDEMPDLARRNQAQAGVTNVEWLKGHIEEVPSRRTPSMWSSPTASSTSPPTSPASYGKSLACCAPAAGSASATSSPTPTWTTPPATTCQQYTGCIAGALTREEFARYLDDAGLVEAEITVSHRVHEPRCVRGRSRAEARHDAGLSGPRRTQVSSLVYRRLTRR